MALFCRLPDHSYYRHVGIANRMFVEGGVDFCLVGAQSCTRFNSINMDMCILLSPRRCPAIKCPISMDLRHVDNICDLDLSVTKLGLNDKIYLRPRRSRSEIRLHTDYIMEVAHHD